MPGSLKIGVLVSGRGTNLQALIDASREGRMAAEVSVVVSNRPDAQALDRAKKAGIPAFVVTAVNPSTLRPVRPAQGRPEHVEERQAQGGEQSRTTHPPSADSLRVKGESKEAFEKRIGEIFNRHGVNLVILAGFMRIVSPWLISRYKNRIINIHPALLPSFPGLEAQRQALEYGVRVSGCTVHFVDEGCDTGPIILQATVPVLVTDTVESLSERILKEEHKLLPKAVDLLAKNKVKVTGRRVEISEEEK